MKKVLFTLVALVAATVGANAQGQTATLQQGDKMTPYYGPDAFVQAYNAAQKGAVITLSAGTFNTVDSITKQVTIIGNGCVSNGEIESTRISDKTIRHGGSDNLTSLIINANNVKIEGVYFSSNVYIRNVSNTLLRKCYFNMPLHGTHIHKSTVIDQCFINKLYALARGENMCIKNSFLNYLYDGIGMENDLNYCRQNSANNPAYFCNCLIPHYFDYVDSTIQNFVCYGTYKKCILGQRAYDSYFLFSNRSSTDYWQKYIITPMHSIYNEYYYNVFFLYPYKYEKNASGNWVDEVFEEMKTKEMYFDMVDTQTQKGNTSSTWSALFNDDENARWWEVLKSDIPFMGDDGTVVGPYGGTGFSISPSIPRIVESKIDSNTDADGKLNVRIKVEVNK